MTKLIFVHGWGFDPGFWDGLRAELSDIPSKAIALNSEIWPDGVYVTHSMGLPVVLENVTSIQGLVVINGFTQFCSPKGVHPRLLKRMIRQFEKSPEAVWTEFMKNCGQDDPVFSAHLDTELLCEQLKYLENVNVQEIFDRLDIPVQVHASTEDRIIPKSLSESSFADDVIWYKGAGHLLPLHQAPYIAKEIRHYLSRFRE